VLRLGRLKGDSRNVASAEATKPASALSGCDGHPAEWSERKLPIGCMVLDNTKTSGLHKPWQPVHFEVESDPFGELNLVAVAVPFDMDRGGLECIKGHAPEQI
jgi:hypothetical protein